MGEQKIICEGRADELQLCRSKITEYNAEQSFVFNLHGEGGIGKTIVTQELYRNHPNYITEEHTGVMAIYINASGCFSIPALLLRLRMGLGDDPYDFEKFDTMYELYYDASEYIRLKRIREIKSVANRNLSGVILDFAVNSINEEYKNLRKSAISDPIVDFIKFSGPILDRIKVSSILEWIKENEKFKDRLEVVDDIINSKGIFKEEEKLVEFFREAVSDSDGRTKSPFFFFIDNFQNSSPEEDKGFRFQNLDRFFKFMNEIPAFWFISSRNALTYSGKNFYGYELKGVKKDAAENIVKLTRGADKVSNLKDVTANILALSEEKDNRQKADLYSPIIISILCQVLEKEIERNQKRASEQDKFEIPPEIFSDIPEQSALSYYFEMGKTSVDLDCFHALSCTNVWDEYTLAVLREKLQFYLLNTRHILSQDSMTELIEGNSIKLHDRITEALRGSANNRIRFDVYSIMYDAFLEIQETTPILEEQVLRNFFVFAREYCKNLLAGAYDDYRDADGFGAYTVYYKAFLKSVEKAGERISGTMIDIYWNVVREFKEIALKCKVKNSDEVSEAYHKLGVVAYDAGDSRKAEMIDKEFVTFTQESGDRYGKITALNALAVDCSANHSYGDAYTNGKNALDAALNVIKEIAEGTGNDSAKELYDFYYRYLRLPESFEEFAENMGNHKTVIENYSELLNEIRSIGKDLTAGKVKEVWEVMLRTRGNIPWYLIEDPSIKREKARFALPYGQDTYFLRKFYYGADNPGTLQSYHNTGVYLMKYAQYCDSEKIHDDSSNIVEAFSMSKVIFSRAYEMRRKALKASPNIGRDQYFEEIEMRAENENISFSDVFDKGTIERFLEDGYDNCPSGALESLQYKSNVCYLLSQKGEDTEQKEQELNEAIWLSDRISVARSILLGPHHRKTLESMRYSAEYYWAKGEKEAAEKRIRYAFGFLDEKQVSERQYKEYKELLDRITDET